MYTHRGWVRSNWQRLHIEAMTSGQGASVRTHTLRPLTVKVRVGTGAEGEAQTHTRAFQFRPQLQTRTRNESRETLTHTRAHSLSRPSTHTQTQTQPPQKYASSTLQDIQNRQTDKPTRTVRHTHTLPHQGQQRKGREVCTPGCSPLSGHMRRIGGCGWVTLTVAPKPLGLR